MINKKNRVPQDWDDYTTSPSPTGRTTEFTGTTGTTTETREQITTTWLTTTPPTSVVHVQTRASLSPERERTRRDTVDWCSVLPGELELQSLELLPSHELVK